MSRAKEFDVAQTLSVARNVFWEKGYEATSIEDLVSATGVNRASLYGTFGGKRELYRKALEQFGEEQSLEAATSKAAPGLAKIRAAFRWAGEQTAADPRGCLMVNAIVEQAATDTDILQLGATAREGLDAFFASNLDQASRRGEIAAMAKSKRQSHARLLVSILFGLRVMAKTAPPPGHADSVVEAALEILAKP